MHNKELIDRLKKVDGQPSWGVLEDFSDLTKLKLIVVEESGYISLTSKGREIINYEY